MTARERLLFEIEVIQGMQWLIKDRVTVNEAYNEMQRAIDERRKQLEPERAVTCV